MLIKLFLFLRKDIYAEMLSSLLLKQAQRQVVAQRAPFRQFAALTNAQRRKYEIPELGEYSDLFADSRIME